MAEALAALSDLDREEMAAQLASIVSAKAPGAKMVTTAQSLTVT